MINMDKRQDRLKQSNVHIPFERFQAIDGSTLMGYPVKQRGFRGCYRSHLAVLKLCLEQPDDIFIIFEDDAKLLPDFDKRLEQAMSELPSDWDILFLGGRNMKNVYEYSEHLLITDCVYQTHAVVYRKKFIQPFIDHLSKREWKFDVLLSDFLQEDNEHKAFICNPILAQQAPGFSDLELRFTNNEIR